MLSRRNFMQISSSALVGLGLGTALTRRTFAETFKTRPKKAILGSIPSAESIEHFMEVGIEGMEILGSPSLQEAEAARKVAESLNFHFHSLMGGGSIDRLELAAALGAKNVLLVPGRVSGVPMPEPWEFQIEFDAKTNRLLKVVDGDNAPFQAYIDAHNVQMEGARRLVESLIPTAEKLGMTIGLENVWNNMWVHPKFASNFIRSFESPWVKAYFDIGNNVKYCKRPQEWFDELRGCISRVHLKDFKLNDDGHGGRFARLMEGSVDWVAIRKKMEEVGFDTWMSVELEGCPLTIEEQARRMDLILEAKPLA